MITAKNITDGQLSALAKFKAATCIRIGGTISDAVARLTYLETKRVTSVIMVDLIDQGLIYWDNGTVITAAGDSLLTEIINARAASKETK